MRSKLDSPLIYEALMAEDSNYRVTIGGLAGGSVSGVLNAPVPIAGGNEFESAKAALSKLPLVGKLADASSAVSDIVRISGNDTTMSIEQTRKVWQESRTPQLNVEVTFWNIDTQSANRPETKVKRIYSALFPTKRDNFLVQAPLGYKFNSGETGKATGTLSLRMGQWFFATGLVMVDANFTPSLEVCSDGTPLYYTGSVTLEPYRMIIYEEFLSWFRAAKPRQVHGSNEAPKKPTSDLDNFVTGVKKQTEDFLGQFKKIS